MRENIARVRQYAEYADQREALGCLLELPDHIDIVKYYRAMPNKLGDAEDAFKGIGKNGEESLHFV